MDLKSIINNTEAVDRSLQRQTTPITPVQVAPPQHSFREFSHHPSTTSSKHLSHDYGVRGPESFADYQRAYQRPSAPTPLQTPSQQDPRSPTGNSQYSAQSPYSRQSIGASQYPFPHNPSPQSPAQGQPHPNSLQKPDGYPQPQTLPPHLQHHSNPYAPSPAPQMPATPISGNPYSQHQRSQSFHSHSTSTPTSAHSQSQQYIQFSQDSPVSASSFQHTHLPQHQRQPSQPERQPSQPGTPLGPPISNPRPNSGGFPQPLSPYQQRPPSSGTLNQHFTTPQNSTPPLQQPHIPRPSEIPNHNSSHLVSTTEILRPQILRDRSMSVSPKTQLPGLPRAEVTNIEPEPTENGYIATPKRKIEDRDGSEPVSTAQIANGTPSTQSRTISPQQPSRKRVRYNEPPIWARSFTGRVKNTGALLGVKQPINIKLEHSSQQPNGHQLDTAPVNKPTQIAQPDFQGQLPLGAWEPSLTGIRPYEEVSKRVADWLFTQVVSRPDMGELASRGVEVEIEAKLGQLIDKGTNERYRLPVVSECVLAETGKVAFKSSVTEANHKELNDFLNAQVKETHPENPRRTKQRVQVVYAHRRERDKFYELPPSHYATLPACMRSALSARQTIKVRVTFDQKTGEVLAKIIKARVDSMDVFNPSFPLDCRISINLEMKYDGNLEELIALSQNSRIPDRNKDRLSYTHSHYQIDLTQVTTVADTGIVTEKEHELEIEVSAAAVREQGRLAQSREPNQYGELVEGLMDNVRVLARRKA